MYLLRTTFRNRCTSYVTGTPRLKVQVRHRRTCREARAPKELSSARLCDPPEAQLSAGDTPAESCNMSENPLYLGKVLLFNCSQQLRSLCMADF